MATYKVIQDVEAEDKLLGPLTFRQFVYGLVCAFFLFLAWFAVTRGAVFIAPFFLPLAAAAGFFAYPWGRDQPTEVWALAKIRFHLKPRKRIWDQSGVKELVTVTAPRADQAVFANNISQSEVKSRLHSLADTLDSRGWAVRGASTNLFQQSGFAAQIASEPDRLVSAAAFQAPATDDTQAADDMFDEQNNPRAQRVSNLINASTQARRKKVIDEMQQPAKPQPARPAPNNWFMNQPGSGATVPGNMVTFNTQVVTPQAPAQAQPTDTPTSTAVAQPQAPAAPINEDELVKELEARKQESPMRSYYGHMHKILPIDEQKRQAAQKQAADQARAKVAAAQAAKKQQTEEQAQRQAALRHLAGNNDLNVATLAREAKRSSGEAEGEVVVKLH